MVRYHPYTYHYSLGLSGSVAKERAWALENRRKETYPVRLNFIVRGIFQLNRSMSAPHQPLSVCDFPDGVHVTVTSSLQPIPSAFVPVVGNSFKLMPERASQNSILAEILQIQ